MEPTIKTTNKKTGQVFEGTVEEARNFGFSDEFILKKVKASKELEREISGQPELTAEEKKKESQKSDLIKRIDLLEKNYEEAELKGPAAGRLKILSTLSGGAIAPEVADYEALRKGMIGPVARVISAEAGVLTDQDIKRAEGLLPKLSDTEKVVKSKLENIRSLLGKKSVSGEKPLQDISIEKAGNGEAKGLYSNLRNLLSGEQQSVQEQGVAPTALRTLFPATQLAKPEGRGAAGEVAGTLILSKLLGGGGLSKAGQGIKKAINPRRALSEARTVAAKSSGAKINTSKIVKAGEKYLESDPAASKYLKTAKTAIESAKSPVKLLDRMKVWKTAYTSASKVGKSSKAGLYNELYRASLKELVKNAPEVAKYQKYLRLSYQVPKTLSKAAWQTLKVSAIGRLFGIGG